jgi:transcription antitermination factor NusG
MYPPKLQVAHRISPVYILVRIVMRNTLWNTVEILRKDRNPVRDFDIGATGKIYIRGLFIDP